MRVCFVVPAHGRFALARICLTRLAQVCEELDARAIVIASDDNYDTAKTLGLAVIRRDNSALGRRFNDGFQYAAAHADYAMPLGSDDLITPRLVEAMLDLHDGDDSTVVCTQLMATVRPDGRELATLRLDLNRTYDGGAGPRLYPAELLQRAGGRPADETLTRNIDGSTRRGLEATGPVRFVYVDADPLELTDVKTEAANLTTYDTLLQYATGQYTDPWERLAAVHPPATVAALQALYA